MEEFLMSLLGILGFGALLFFTRKKDPAVSNPKLETKVSELKEKVKEMEQQEKDLNVPDMSGKEVENYWKKK